MNLLFRRKSNKPLNEDLDDDKKRVVTVEQISEKLKEGIEKKGCMVFGLNVAEWDRINLTSSVAIEEVH